MVLKKNKLPSFFIIGAQKCGTTYLNNLLGSSPFIYSPPKKEIDFFSSNLLYTKGISFYKKSFNCPLYTLKTFEACPNYMYYEKAIKRIYKFNPNSKLIIIIKNPVERFISAWNMYYLFFVTNDDNKWYSKTNVMKNYFGIMPSPHNLNGISFLKKSIFPSLDEVIEQEISDFKKNKLLLEPGFLTRGLYIEQIKNILKYFNNEQLLVINNNQINSSLPQIKSFLGIVHYPFFTKKVNGFIGTYKNEIPISKLEQLHHFYEPYNQELYHFLKKDLKW
ncbi:MAG: sulfotransferase [Saprospiraceae bacterium]